MIRLLLDVVISTFSVFGVSFTAVLIFVLMSFQSLVRHAVAVALHLCVREPHGVISAHSD